MVRLVEAQDSCTAILIRSPLGYVQIKGVEVVWAPDHGYILDAIWVGGCLCRQDLAARLTPEVVAHLDIVLALIPAEHATALDGETSSAHPIPGLQVEHKYKSYDDL